jgi:uncharacterized protein
LKIEGTSSLPVPPEEAYRIMQDPEVLARAIPGCESLERTGENEYRMKMKMALASLSGAFEGKVRITDQDPPTGFRMLVEGSGRVGFLKGDGVMKLTPAASGTEVAYQGDIQIGGTIAAVGQRLIDSTARMIIKKFFDNLAVSR